MADLEQKLKGFLTWYQDMYGPTFYAEEKMSPLETFRAEIAACQKCPLHKTRTNLVFGEGSEHAKIMFIGEAPGYEEDRQGRPFVGRSGKLLNKLLEAFDLRREDVFIANILKSRPPDNRDPKPEEVDACIPYLHRQIEIIAPRVLIALGRVAGQNLLNSKDALKSLRRRRHFYHETPLFVTYHPAYILRNMSAYGDLTDDFKFILSHIDGND